MYSCLGVVERLTHGPAHSGECSPLYTYACTLCVLLNTSVTPPPFDAPLPFAHVA
jgi:hypothetical protein